MNIKRQRGNVRDTEASAAGFIFRARVSSLSLASLVYDRHIFIRSTATQVCGPALFFTTLSFPLMFFSNVISVSVNKMICFTAGGDSKTPVATKSCPTGVVFKKEVARVLVSFQSPVLMFLHDCCLLTKHSCLLL